MVCSIETYVSSKSRLDSKQVVASAGKDFMLFAMELFVPSRPNVPEGLGSQASRDALGRAPLCPGAGHRVECAGHRNLRVSFD